MSENDVFAQLPENADERTGHLIDMAVETATEFLGTHNLEVKVPAEARQEIARALDEGRKHLKSKKSVSKFIKNILKNLGRGKLKKMMGPIALAIGAKLFALLPILLGGLALLTTKAIIVAKIALFLAILVGGSKFFGGLGSKFGGALGGGYNANAGWSGASSNVGGWSSGASSAYPYARSINENADAQELAYAGQVNAQ